ncbi:hypothetical protein G7046_g3813 [Stylonectria norvegica]|nr:hypothetical protein G7046_g3813 [Stylonectria norvegica]
MFAFQHGGPTTFFRDHMNEVRMTLASKGLWSDYTSAPPPIKHQQLDIALCDILLDLTGLCSLLNNNSFNGSLDAMTFQEIMVSLCFRLLRFRTLNDSRHTFDLQVAPHIGFALFIMSIFLQYSKQRIVDYGLVSLCLRDVLESDLDGYDDGFLLWLVVLGGIWVSNDADSVWILPRIRTVAARMDLHTWDDARGLISKFPWLDAIHGQLGRNIWNKAHQDHRKS